MEEKIICCVDCFYSNDTYDTYPVVGRDIQGVEVESDELFFSSVTCYAEPEPKVVSKVEGDIEIEPEYHVCGRGRWWNGGCWKKWIDIHGDIKEVDNE